MTRVPYADRPENAIYCTCPRDSEGARERQHMYDTKSDGRRYLVWYHLTDPKCPLHGDDRKEAPF